MFDPPIFVYYCLFFFAMPRQHVNPRTLYYLLATGIPTKHSPSSFSALEQVRARREESNESGLNHSFDIENNTWTEPVIRKLNGIFDIENRTTNISEWSWTPELFSTTERRFHLVVNNFL